MCAGSIVTFREQGDQTPPKKVTIFTPINDLLASNSIIVLWTIYQHYNKRVYNTHFCINVFSIGVEKSVDPDQMISSETI